MTFALDTHWVWDFWLADDGDLFHMYYLNAPKSLGDPNLRHRNARIGHATSEDLIAWQDLGNVITPGPSGAFDDTATWTGSVIEGPDGVWRMFYTGAHFLDEDSHANIESVGVATSTDLHNWTKSPGPIATADGRWYEKLGDSSWQEEAWRDPWVFADPAGNGWHMLITARANHGDELDRGVIAHAVSPDLNAWEVRPPLSAPGSGFNHLEVPQVVTIDSRGLLLFSCDSAQLAGKRAGGRGGIWGQEIDSLIQPYEVETAQLVLSEELYSGRVIQDRSGQWVLLAFANNTSDGEFMGSLSDPFPITWGADHGSMEILIPSGESA